MKIITIMIWAATISALVFWYNVEPVFHETQFTFNDLWYHEKGRYSFGVNMPDGQYLTVEHGYCGELNVFKDVPDDEPMYYVNKYWIHSMTGCDYKRSVNEIHIHKSYKMHGAGWDHGKFGRGMTNHVE